MESVAGQIPGEHLLHGVVHCEALEQGTFAQLTALSSGISRLVPTDAEVFRQAFQQEEICYANSWLYMLRSSRNDQGELGYKFVGEETLMGIGYRNNTLYLVHPIGRGRFHETMNLCQRIGSSMKCLVILKKIDQELYTYLHATGLFHTHASSLTLLEEEAFPEHILQLEKLYSPASASHHQLQPLIRKVKRFAKSSMSLLTETDISDIETCSGFQHLFGSNPEKYKSYKQMIQEISSQGSDNDRYKVCIYRDKDETIHGLYIGELLEKGSMGLYCAVSSRAFPGITEWMDYDFFQQIFHEGIHSLYLGGSETEGVHAYIQKLLPMTPPYFMQPMQFLHDQYILHNMG